MMPSARSSKRVVVKRTARVNRAVERALDRSRSILGLTEAQVRKLAALGRQAIFKENDVMLVSGKRSRYFYILLSGSASVEMAAAFVTVGVQALSAGDAFGWTSLLDHHETLFQVRARERCSALRLDGAAVAVLCREDPELGVQLLRQVLQTVAGRVRGLESRCAECFGLSQRSRKAE